MLKESLTLARKSLDLIASNINEELNLVNSQWAIVGGYIRDLLLSIEYNTTVQSPDLDIAVIGDLPTLNKNSKIVSLNRNTFGGYKITTKSNYIVDLWSITPKTSEPDTWKWYTQQIDFNINAILYIYPEKEFVVNEKWDINNRIIEQLCVDSPLPTLQSIRALALAYKLTKYTLYDYNPSQEFLERLVGANESEKYIVDCYIDKKINSNKWDVSLCGVYRKVLKGAYTNMYNYIIETNRGMKHTRCIRLKRTKNRYYAKH